MTVLRCLLVVNSPYGSLVKCVDLSVTDGWIAEGGGGGAFANNSTE